MRMRTIDQAADYIKSTDPETAVTKTALRRLVVTGIIPSVRVGQKYLVSLEAVYNYLAGAVPRPVQTASGVIHPVEV